MLLIRRIAGLNCDDHAIHGCWKLILEKLSNYLKVTPKCFCHWWKLHVS